MVESLDVWIFDPFGSVFQPFDVEGIAEGVSFNTQVPRVGRTDP